ncbi:bifunctional enoyl-CoA hydratase/phosphate acetyltransferase [Luteithermobacter gelatinilyticus]|uniref:bifunctional enoyl-CoA hydratase/phosphate acetyltransferase n=1 Tax=Luteithermobacter gelatinilyticus TaxID=2582913 RepID=UPI0011058C2D|nr:bifunctional enoyl-CoA hydratase/phosphate acetyltransferase [Luteithermobacter gelatinilyticus]|tara:strand:+ start:7056 stop:8015 length:960 start_codon:yes stop_codon:yes gene_type:complete
MTDIFPSPTKPADGRYTEIIARTHTIPPRVTAIVHPVDAPSLQGALDAAREGMLIPLLVGPEAKIKAAAEAIHQDISGYDLINVPHSHAAAERAVELVREGRAVALMKGALHTDELISAVLHKEKGLRTERRLSHIFVMDVPRYHKLLFISDAAINIYPDLTVKKDIVQNTIDLAQALGIETPKVAILSAVETINPKITSTVDAAALCKMSDRNQITGGILDGPLAFDNAISLSAARTKGIKSEVAGDADVLIVPDLEAGNMLAKQLEYLAGAEAAGIVLGAKVPIILTSRADSAHSRLCSCAVAQLLVSHREKTGSPL